VPDPEAPSDPLARSQQASAGSRQTSAGSEKAASQNEQSSQGNKPAPAPSDDELVRRVKEGERKAFDLLMERYERRITAVSYQMLGSSEEAKDLAQEAFLRIWRGIPNFRGEASFLSWAYQITMNLARHRRRWYARHRVSKTISLDAPIKEGEEDPVSERIADPGPDPRQKAASSDELASLQQAVGELPLPFKSVLVLRDIQGLAYEEVAKVFGEQIGTIKSRLHRARLMLRKALERGGRDRV